MTQKKSNEENPQAISKDLNAWFLGPKGENEELLESLIIMALRHHIHWRANYWPQGDPIITEVDMLDETYKKCSADIKSNTRLLLDKLKEGFPFYSPRYLAHMLHDTVIPAMVGYFAGMLYNANNVTYEASPVTTILEMRVADDLSKMLGFQEKHRGEIEVLFHNAANGIQDISNANKSWGGIVTECTREGEEWNNKLASMLDSLAKICDKELDNEDGIAENMRKTATSLREFDEYDECWNTVVETLEPLAIKLDEIFRDENAWSIISKLLHAISQEQTWGHLTSGGTVANIESLWVARNIKYFPLIVAQMCRDKKIDLKINIKIGNKEKLLNEMDLSNKDDIWSLLNLDLSEVHKLRQSLFDSWSKEENNELKTTEAIRSEIKEMLKKVSRNKINCELLQNGIKLPVIIAPQSSHYSIEKAVDILGIGVDRLIKVEVDECFRMDISKLKSCLDHCFDNKVPIIAVIGIIGSTEEGAIDPLHMILKLRDEFKSRDKPLTFFVHADAAFGGYARSIFLGNISPSRDPNDQEAKTRQFGYDFLSRDVVNHIITGELIGINEEGTLRWAKPQYDKNYKNTISEKVGDWPSEHVYEAFKSIGNADTVTVDPHKLGFVPYPAGAVIYREKKSRDFLQQDAPYIFSSEEGSGSYVDKYIGRFILEGSKPGASATACWLAHRCISQDFRGYGAIIGENIRAARTLYHHLKNPDDLYEDDLVKIVPICEPDLNIVCFIVGSRKANPQYSIKDLNSLNENILKQFSIDFDKRKDKIIYSQPFWLSGSSFENENYLFDRHARRFLEDLQISPIEQGKIWKVKYLRAVIMDPWFSSTAPGEKDIIKAFIECLLKVAHEEIVKLDAKLKAELDATHISASTSSRQVESVLMNIPEVDDH